MKHPGKNPWFAEDQCGPLFVFYCEDKDSPAEERVEWYLCPDNEDKCQRRAIASGRASSIELAMTQVADTVAAIAHVMLAWTANTPIGAELESEIARVAVKTFNVGDRVSWMGGIDFGRREVRWFGVITSVSCGVAVKFKLNDRNEHVEDGPRVPAARVKADPGQHGLLEDPRYAGMEESTIVKFSDLTLEPIP